MISLKFWLNLFIISLTLKATNSSRSFEIRWTRTNCSIISPNYVNYFECPLKELPRDRGNVLTALVVFNQNIIKSLIDFRVSMPGIGGLSKETEIMKFRIDACKMANYQTGNPIVNTMVKRLVQLGNFPKGCPLRKNLSYKLENFALNPDYFPTNTPVMKFTTTINMFTGKSHVIYASIDAKIVKKNHEKF